MGSRDCPDWRISIFVREVFSCINASCVSNSAMYLDISSWSGATMPALYFRSDFFVGREASRMFDLVNVSGH